MSTHMVFNVNEFYPTYVFAINTVDVEGSRMS